MPRAVIVLLACCLAVRSAAAVEFTHPSILSTQADLAALKTRVASNPSGKLGYDQLRTHAFASLTRQATPYQTVYVVASGGSPSEGAFRSDGQAAHACALMWVITGDARYRDKAIANLDAWGATNQAILPASGTSSNQVNLECAWALPIWLAAADIIRYYDHGAAGWSADRIATFDRFVNRMKGYARKALSTNSNWGASAVLAVMAAAVYQENQSDYALALSTYLTRLKGISKASGALGPDYLRDPWHPQYTITCWMQSCELAWNQGDDLYGITLDGQALPRLAIVLEHFSKLFLGELPNPVGLATGDFKGSHLKFQAYDLGANHYLGRRGLAASLPVFTRMVPAWRPGGIDGHFMAWSTLTHGQLSSPTAPVNLAPSVSAGPDRSITLPASASLDGTVSDDGLPAHTLTTTWSKVSGPGSVSFTAPGAIDTTAAFSVAGTYVLRLSASDGALSSSDEVQVVVAPASVPEPIVLPVAALAASTHQTGNPPANAIDKNLATRWSAEGDGQWIRLDLGTACQLEAVAVAVYLGDTRQAKFELQVSDDGLVWTTVFNGRSSGTSTGLETFPLPGIGARFVRLLGHGNTSNAWNSITEIQAFGIAMPGGSG